jgi:hypothetical protein
LAPSATILTEPDTADGVGRDLILERRRDEDLDFLPEPSVAGQRFIAESLRLTAVDLPVDVGGRAQLLQIDAVRFAVGVTHPVLVIPTRDALHAAAQALVEGDGVLRHVAESLEARPGFAWIELEIAQRLAHGDHDPVAGRLFAPEGAAQADRLPGDDARAVSRMQRLVFVEHPQHMAGARHQIRPRDVPGRAEVEAHPSNPAAAEPLLFQRTQVVRVAGHPAHAAPQGQDDDGTRPGHQQRQRLDVLGGFLRVEAQPAAARAAGVVVLNARTVEHAHPAVVHAHRDGKAELADGGPQEIPGGRIQTELFGDLVELAASRVEQAVGRLGHRAQPAETVAGLASM